MLYVEFINKAAGLTIVQADNGLFYLEPLWQSILEENGMNFAKSGKFSRNEVSEVLKLEVERRNTINSKKNDVVEWIYDIITSTVEPAVLAEETDFVKNMVEYLKVSHEIQKNQDNTGDFDGDDNIVPFPTNEG